MSELCNRTAAPYLRRISWVRPDETRPTDYPFSLAVLEIPDWDTDFTTPVTIIAGENVPSKSTLIEALAGCARYDEIDGGKTYRPVDHTTVLAVSGTQLAAHLRAAWLPKITAGWFFRPKRSGLSRAISMIFQGVGPISCPSPTAKGTCGCSLSAASPSGSA